MQIQQEEGDEDQNQGKKGVEEGNQWALGCWKLKKQEVPRKQFDDLRQAKNSIQGGELETIENSEECLGCS